MRKQFLVASFLLASVIIAPGISAADSKKSYPSYKFLRFQENWSALKAWPEDERGIKYVELTESGSVWASFGGHARYRFEDHQNFAFGGPADNDDGFSLWRATLHSDIHFGETFRFFGEVKTANGDDRDLPNGPGSTGFRGLDRDTIALQQAFFDINHAGPGDSRLTWRVGRQELSFGKQRLVSPLPWGNTLRTWDGIRTIWQTGKWTVSPFYTEFVPVQQQQNNTPDDNQSLAGIYATHKTSSATGYDIYWLSSNRLNVTFNGTTGGESRETFGVHLWDKKWLDGKLDYDLELAYQTGEVGSDDVNAYMLALEVGYKTGAKNKLRWFAGLDYASGDDEPGGDVETFIAPFPLGHAYLGFIDIVGRQNIIDVSGGASFKLSSALGARIAVHHFLLESDNDGLYNAGGGLVRAAPANNNEDEVGQEIDITLKYTIDRNWTASLGVSRFFAGDFIGDTGSDDDINFAYFAVNVMF